MKKILIALSLLLPIIGHSQTISTYAGTGVAGYSGDGGLATAAKLSFDSRMAIDASGNIYIADQNNNAIRKINSSGIITTVAGTGIASYSGDGGPATAANLNKPYAVDLDAAGNLYIADTYNQRIRKISTTGIITTIAGNGTAGYTGDGGPATAAEFSIPGYFRIDPAGNIIVADNGNQRVRKINTSGIVSTIAGTGVSGFSGDGGMATAAKISYPQGIGLDAAGNIYIGDANNQRIREINTGGIIFTVAGNGTAAYGGDGGPATAAELNTPQDIYFDAAGNMLFTDTGNDRVRKISTTGIITTIAGNGVASYGGDGGPATAAELLDPNSIRFDAAGSMYIADAGNNRIRKVPAIDYAPHFTGGHIQTLSVCENSTADPINSLLAVIDSDAGQTETWSIVTAPAHGTVVVTYSTTSTGGILTPTGLSYTPTAGYSGTDVFKVRVTDGIASDTTQINVVVNALPSAGTILGASTVCAGSSISLSDSSATTWNSTNTGIATVSGSGVVTGVAVGTVTIICIGGNSCGSDTAYHTITVNPTPLPPNIIPNPICVGSSTPLTDGTVGGVWSSSNSGVASVDTLSTLTANTTGTATITYLLTTGCFSTKVVTVSPTPSAILGVKTVCIGLTSQLTDAVAGGTWSSTTPAVASISLGGLVSGLSVGTTTISYSIGSCYATAIVTVTPTPTITGKNTLCVGSADTLAGPAGSTWSSSNTAVATVSSAGLVFGLSAGVATITCVASTGCIATLTITANPSPTPISGGVGVSVGSTLPLSDATGSGTWSSSNVAIATVGSTTGIVTGVSSGIVIITYTLPGGCYVTHSVQVSGVTFVGPINGTASVCVGSSRTLSDTTSGGHWSSSNTAVATVGSSSGIVIGISPGTSTISYTVGTTSASIIFTVYAVPTAITGSLSVCVGATTALTDAVAGGTWSSSSSNATVTSVGVVTGAITGTATITYSNGGCLASAIVTVYPAPAISGTETVCVGGTTTLTATGSISWSSSNTSVATISATGIVTGIATGTATITCIVSTGCSTTTTVTVNASSPIIPTGAVSICLGSTAGLTDATGGGTWSSSNAGVATVGGTGIVTGVAIGTSTISYVLSSGCSATKIVTVNNAPVAITPHNPSVCLGSTLLLTDATSGGTWTSTVTGVATVSTGGLVTSLAAGITEIDYSIGTCIARDTFTVLSGPAAITPSPVTLCLGSAASLSDATTGGTWSSSATGIVSVTIGGAITSHAIGTATISYTIGSCSATTIVTVNAAPGAISPASPSVCAGSSVTLTDATTGGTWSSSNTAVATVAGGVVTGITAGTSTISYAIGTCYSTTLIIVNPVPTTITGASTVIAGSQITLSDATTGGTWSSSNTAIATVGATGIVTGVTAGTVTIYYTTAGGCQTSHIVTVTSLSGINGTASVCAGGSVTLVDSTAGGHWSSSNTAVATVGSSTGIVTSVSAGVCTISYTVGTSVTTITFTVYAAPATIAGGSSVTAGSQITLSDAVTGGTWSSSNAAVATVGSSTGIVTGVTAGTVTIYYITTGGCQTSHTVTVTALTGIHGTASVCAGSAATLIDSTAGGHWSSSNTAIATVGSSTGIVTGVSAGTCIISYTVGTSVTTITFTVFAVPTTISGSSAVIAGSVITLSDAVAGGTWSSSNTAVATVGSLTGSVTGVSPGTATITYTTAGGCQTTHVVTVTAISGIHGTASVCAGSTVTLNDSTAGGHWSSSNAAIATVGSSTGIVTGVSAGTCIISYTLGTSSTTVVFTVYAAPAAIAGSSTVIAGSVITLSDAVAGGLWSSSNTAVATVGSLTGTVTGVSPGTVIITYAMAGGCMTTHTVTVTALTGISGTASVCAGSTITLTDANAGGHWSSSNTGIATVGSSTGVVTGVSAGTCIISYTLGTSSVIVTFTVNPSPAAISGGSTVIVGFTLTLSDAVAGGTWGSSAPSIATMSSAGTVTAVSPGIVTINYTLPGGCQATHVVTVTALPGIKGTDNVCIGSTRTLTDSIAGGHWSSSNTSIATVGASTGVVTGISSGTCTLTYTVGTNITTVTFTVNFAAPILGSTLVAVGGTITLSDASGGGVWLSSLTPVATIGSATGVVNGISAGTATIYYVVTLTGCSTSIVVTVNIPIHAIHGSASVCDGSTITLADSTTGGNWSSSNTAIATVGLSTGVVTGVSAGTCIISYTVGTSVATFIVTANAAPPISGSSIVSAGGTITLSDASPGGTWLSSLTPVATVGSATGLVNGITGGTATIYYVTTAGCYAYHIVTVTTTPAVHSITGTGNVCEGSTRTLTDSTAGGHWSSSNTAVATVGSSTGVVTGVAGGTCTITYAVGAGFATITFTVNAVAAIAGSTTVHVGSTITLSDAVAGGLWSSSSATIAAIGSSTGIVTGESTGSVNIYYVTPAGCLSYHSVTVAASGAREAEETAQPPVTHDDVTFSLFPNPASDNINLTWQGQLSDAGQVTITDMAGHVVYTSAMDVSNTAHQVQIPTSGFKNGIYLLDIVSGNVHNSSKISVIK